MKQIKQKKKIYGILAMLLMVGGLAGAMLCWTPGTSPDNAQVSQETKTTSEAVETPTTGAEQKKELPASVKPAAQPVIPAVDELAYTFEGTKLFIAAGSVTVDGNGNLWQAKVKNVTAKGTVGPERLVYFKLQGNDVMTRLEHGNWRLADDMDRSVYRKVTAIVTNP